MSVNYYFNAELATKECVDWIKEYFVHNGNINTVAIIGISGGKDSSVAAALCAKALGRDRVVGVKMPQGAQYDIDFSDKLISFLGIEAMNINIGKICDECYSAISSTLSVNNTITSNLPARVRMTILYSIAGGLGGRVVNTCNLSEEYVGYSTKFGDGAGDFAPLANFTSSEVIEIGKVLGLPEELLNKIPEDGLSGLSDEENLGFSYEVLNDYISKRKLPDARTLYLIEEKHRRSKHKTTEMPKFYFSYDVLKSKRSSV